jgi:hypothetical protein
MKNYLWILGLFTIVTLGGCTTVTTYHNACTEYNHTIATQVGCVRANVQKNPGMQDDTLVQEYLRTGDMLVQRVAAGQMSETQAQLQFVQKLNQIKQTELNQMAQQARIDRAYDRMWYPRCRHHWNSIECMGF